MISEEAGEPYYVGRIVEFAVKPENQHIIVPALDVTT